MRLLVSTSALALVLCTGVAAAQPDSKTKAATPNAKAQASQKAVQPAARSADALKPAAVATPARSMPADMKKDGADCHSSKASDA